MSKVFVITNQHGHFIDKHRQWVDGRDTRVLFRSPHKDEAINLVFELSSKDIYLRAEAISVDLDDKSQPVVEVTAEPFPEPACPEDETGGDTEACDAPEEETH